MQRNDPHNFAVDLQGWHYVRNTSPLFNLWRLAEALALYESQLPQYPDPAIHYRAYLISHKLGWEHRAEQHFLSAEAGFQRAIDAGQIYTLEGLARLYCDAGIQLDRALSLAQQNLNFKRDIEAHKAVACIYRRIRENSIGWSNDSHLSNALVTIPSLSKV